MPTIGSEPRRSFLALGSAAALGSFGEARPALAAAEGSRTHRRVVTGTTGSGKSTVVSDGPVPSEANFSDPKVGNTSDDLWVLQKVPVDLADQRDPVVGYSRQAWPPPGGVIARIITWGPGFAFRMHRSATIDFIFVVSGRIELLLDEKSVILGPGDSAVQRGTNHGWRVVGDEPCTFAAVLVSATA